jgi:hypothetical protein
MSLINELEDISLKMSPRFMRNISEALELALEEETTARLETLKGVLGDFYEVVKIMGLDELKERLENLGRILNTPGPPSLIIRQFRAEFIPMAERLGGDDREFLKKKEIIQPQGPTEADPDVISLFMTLPGIGEERAHTLFTAGFKSKDDLSKASVATLFGVPGMTLAAAKKIADYFNPDRLVRVQTHPREEETSPRDEYSFVGKSRAPSGIEATITDEVETGDDPELIGYFIDLLTEYLEGATSIVSTLSSGAFTTDIIVHLEEITHGLEKAARYMGFTHIRVAAQQIDSVIKDIISGDDQLSKATISFLFDSLSRIEAGCANLKKSAERLGEKSDNIAVSLEYNVLTMAHYWGELFDLYKDTHEILRRASQQGKFSDQDLDRLRHNTHRLDEMAGSISELVEVLA